MNTIHQQCLKCGRVVDAGAAVCGKCGGTELRPYSQPKFVAAPRAKQVPALPMGCAVMQGSECVAVAKSHTFAKRIANALNIYKPNREGV